MAERRMFAKTIIDSDAFLEMPATSQLLYFHLSIRADDDGFINKPKTIMRMVGSKDDDINLLIARKFLIPFESGVVVIKHWKIHNYIQNDRYNETKYKSEKAQLALDENKAYTLQTNQCIQNVSIMETQVRLGKDRIGKDSKEKNMYGEFKNVLLTLDEFSKLEKKNLLTVIEDLSYYIRSKGDKYKDHYATILMWDKKNKGSAMKLPEHYKNNRYSDPDYVPTEEEEKRKADLIKQIKEMDGNHDEETKK